MASPPDQSEAAAPASACRCGACGQPLPGLAQWTCPACRADLHEAGIVVHRSWREKLDESVRTASARLGRRSPEPGARCGRCRYPVKGLTGFTCPECGSDLRVVGAAVERFTAGPILVFLACAALWLLLVGVFLRSIGHTVIEAKLPHQVTATMGDFIRIDAPADTLPEGGPRGRHVNVMDATITGTLDRSIWPGEQARIETITATLRPGAGIQGPAANRQVRLDISTLDASYRATFLPEGPGSPPPATGLMAALTESDLLRLLAWIGVDPPADASDREAFRREAVGPAWQSLMELASFELRNRTRFHYGSGSSSASSNMGGRYGHHISLSMKHQSRPIRAFGVAFDIVIGLLAVGGIVLVLWRSRPMASTRGDQG